MKGGGITILKVVIDKLSIKDWDFVDFLIIRYGSIRIIKFKSNGKKCRESN